jgi:predicted small secreted protein
MRPAIESRPLIHVVVVAAVLIAACGGGQGAEIQDAGGGERSDPRAVVCTAQAEGGAAAPSFSTLQQVFDQDCSACHVPGADLDLSPGVAWANLVNHPAPATESCGGILVVPGDPGASYLYQKLSSATPCSGLQMPRGDFGSESPIASLRSSATGSPRALPRRKRSLS